MTTHSEAVVGGVDEIRIIGMWAVFYGFHDAPNLFIKMSD